MVDLLRKIAVQKQATPAQIALAWLIAQKPWIVPISGTTKMERLRENLGAVAVELTDADLHQIDDAASTITIEGARYPDALEQRTGLREPKRGTIGCRAPKEGRPRDDNMDHRGPEPCRRG